MQQSKNHLLRADRLFTPTMRDMDDHAEAGFHGFGNFLDIVRQDHVDIHLERRHRFCIDKRHSGRVAQVDGFFLGRMVLDDKKDSFAITRELSDIQIAKRIDLF